MNVLFVSARFWPVLGGAERQLDLLAARLVEGGHRVTVLAQRSAGSPLREKRNGVEVVRLRPLRGGWVNSLRFGIGIWFFLLRNRREFHLYHVNLAGSPALFVGFWAKRLNRPAILKFGASGPQGDAATSRSTIVGRWKLRRLRDLYDYYLCPNQAIRGEFLEEDFPPARLVHFPNGVDAGLFRPAEERDRTALREALGWTDRVVALFTGRFEAQKNLAVLIESWRKVSSDHPQALLVLAGDGSRRLELEKAVFDAGLGEAVRFAGALTGREVRTHLQAADFFVLPSLSEGISNSALEAMSCGLAVVASDIPGNSDLVGHEKEGYLFKSGDRSDLERALDRVIRLPRERARFGAAARSKIGRRFEMGVVTEKYLAMAAELTGRGLR